MMSVENAFPFWVIEEMPCKTVFSSNPICLKLLKNKRIAGASYSINICIQSVLRYY